MRVGLSIAWAGTLFLTLVLTASTDRGWETIGNVRSIEEKILKRR